MFLKAGKLKFTHDNPTIWGICKIHLFILFQKARSFFGAGFFSFFKTTAQRMDLENLLSFCAVLNLNTCSHMGTSVLFSVIVVPFGTGKSAKRRRILK